MLLEELAGVAFMGRSMGNQADCMAMNDHMPFIGTSEIQTDYDTTYPFILHLAAQLCSGEGAESKDIRIQTLDSFAVRSTIPAYRL